MKGFVNDSLRTTAIGNRVTSFCRVLGLCLCFSSSILEMLVVKPFCREKSVDATKPVKLFLCEPSLPELSFYEPLFI